MNIKANVLIYYTTNNVVVIATPPFPTIPYTVDRIDKVASIKVIHYSYAHVQRARMAQVQANVTIIWVRFKQIL